MQRYKCAACGKQFIWGQRPSSNDIWQEYVVKKQIYSQLAKKYSCLIKTIQRKIDKFQIVNLPIATKTVIVLMDTTHFGRGFGVML